MSPDPNTPGTDDAGSVRRLAVLVARRAASSAAAAAARFRARAARAWARRPSPTRGIAVLFVAGAAALG
ncbi:MAG TPA: hypothetical protein VLC54_13695, partial [Anaeromyxobacter sp.]|nr:hypothetical protein [Anaeromyxobacter sp.]